MLDSKDPAEIVPITFDFSELAATVSSVVQVTCVDPTGTDAAAVSYTHLTLPTIYSV